MSRAQLTSTVEQNTGGAVAPFVAGKNKIINGDFGIWQRGTSFTNPANGDYTTDRFFVNQDGSGWTRTVSRQTFTPGTAPVAGYEGKYFWRLAQTVAGSGASYNAFATKLEDVQTLAGQTVTYSFWAKADAARSITYNINQNFGTGGSSSTVTSFGTASVTTSWQRFSATKTLTSLTSKTIGTGSNIQIEMDFPLNTAMTIDIWGVQVEAGSVATPFTTATGTLSGELAACQRYYAKSYAQTVAPATNSTIAGIEFTSTASVAATNTYAVVKLPITMRTSPTVTTYSFTSSTTNVVSNCLGTDLTANSCVPTWANDSQFGVYNNSGGTISASGGGLIFHYTATAEL